MYFDRLKLENHYVKDVFNNVISKKLDVKKFSKGDVLYPKYDMHFDSTRFIFFKSGLAKSVFYDEGEEFILYLLESKNIDVIGGTCTIEFLKDSEVYIGNVDNIFDMISDVNFSKIFLRFMIQKSMTERRIIKNLAFGTAKKKLTYFLIDRALHCKAQNLPLRFDMSVQELSEFIGLKRQTVSYMFNKLLKDNVIRKGSCGKKFFIDDLEKLKQYAQYDIDCK